MLTDSNLNLIQNPLVLVTQFGTLKIGGKGSPTQVSEVGNNPLGNKERGLFLGPFRLVQIIFF